LTRPVLRFTIDAIRPFSPALAVTPFSRNREIQRSGTACPVPCDIFQQTVGPFAVRHRSGRREFSPMAAANESQGLKIAVAVFVTLTVILAVTTYFSYTSYSQAEAKLTASE